jgi:lipopolysaccharide transport system ATP-binding protein
MPAIEVSNLHKVFRIPHEKKNTVFETLTGFFKSSGYETFHALKDINFIVEEGEALGVIGENGSGKSTLLKTIARIIRPTDGNVRVNGKITPFLELGVGFQQDFTAAENVRTYATIMGIQKKEIEAKLDDILNFADLEKFRDTKLKNFSSGMQVRLAFSTAIQTNPEILLMDEVLAVGDMEFQQKCIDVLNQYRKEGVTIVFVSHDLGAVRRFCDKTLLLHKGEQITLGNTQDVIDSYVYSRKESEDPDAQDMNPGSLPEGSTKRWGNRKIEITKVEMYDKFGNKSARFNSFDPMDIRISYNAHEKVPDPIFGIQLYSEKGEQLFGTNTEIKNVIVDHVEGEGHIDLKVERIPMLIGRFLLTVAVHTRDNRIYDWHDKLYRFDVYPTCRDSGLFHIPCTWGL